MDYPCRLLLPLGAALFFSSVAWGGTPIPPRPAARLAVSGVSGSFSFVQTFLSAHQSRIGAEYWIVAVKSCDDDANAYARAVFEKWDEEGGRLDPGRHALIVFCQQGGLIGAHVGMEYSLAGLDGPALAQVLLEDQEIAGFVRTYPPAAVNLAVKLAERALAQAIQESLQARATAQQFLSLVEGEIAEAREALAETRQKCGVKDPPGFAEGEAETRLAEARRWLGASPKEATRIAQELQDKAQAAKKIATEICARNDALTPRVAMIEKALTSLREELPISSGEDDAAEAAVVEVEQALKAVEEARKQGDYDSAEAALARADALILLGKEAVREGRIIGRHRVVYIPLLILLALLIAVSIFAEGRRRVAAAWAECARNSIEVYRLRLSDVAARLEELRLRHAALLKGPEVYDRLSGESRERYEVVGEKVDLLHALLSKASELLDQATRRARSARPFSVAPSRDAMRLLESGEVEIRYGAEHLPSSMMLREERVSRKAAARLLDEITLLFPEAAQELDALGAATQDAGPASERVQQEISRARDLYEKLAGLGVTPSIAQADLARLEKEASAAENDIIHDPIAVAKHAPAIEEAARLLSNRLENALSLAKKAAEDIPLQGEHLWKRVLELRQKGLKLKEATLEPESLKERIDQSCSIALAALTALDFEEAKQEIKNAEEALSSLQRGIEHSLLSRDTGPGELKALRARLEGLQDKLGAAQRALEKIKERNGLQDTRDLSEQMERYPMRVGRLGQLLVEAEQRAEETLFLAAAERRAQISQQLKQLEDFLTELIDRDKLEATLGPGAWQSARKSEVTSLRPPSSDNLSRVVMPPPSLRTPPRLAVVKPPDTSSRPSLPVPKTDAPPLPTAPGSSGKLRAISAPSRSSGKLPAVSKEKTSSGKAGERPRKTSTRKKNPEGETP